MWDEILRIIRQPGADACLVAGVKPGTLSGTGGKPLPPSSGEHHGDRESEHCPLAEKLGLKEGEEATAGQLGEFFQAIAPLVHFVEFSGQRWKDPAKLSANTDSTMTQRVHVMTHIIYPWVLGFKTMVELGDYLGVGKSMIMRHVKDFNVAFGVFASGQKRVSTHGDVGGDTGTYVEAGHRGHETRRRRKAERALQGQLCT